MKTINAIFVCIAFCAIEGTVPSRVSAEVTYSSSGSLYTESFDLLPADVTGNSSAEVLHPDGWMDDSLTENGHIGVPGWYLYHPLSPEQENGFNGHQRLRFGPGANTGAFWAFGEGASNQEKALGSIGSLTMAENGANMYFALRLVNGSGVTLTEFTLAFDGEQWRDGRSETGEILFCGYSLTATAENWFADGEFTAVPDLDFHAPVTAGTGTSGTPVVGNAEGRVPGISATVRGIAWLPGGALWLRWTDPQLGGPEGQSYADDGMAIDNVMFTAAAGAVLPEASLSILTDGNGGKHLQWRGSAGITTQVQHSTDLAIWRPEGAPVLEADGVMTFPLPASGENVQAHFFRLVRVSPNP